MEELNALKNRQELGINWTMFIVQLWRLNLSIKNSFWLILFSLSRLHQQKWNSSINSSSSSVNEENTCAKNVLLSSMYSMITINQTIVDWWYFAVISPHTFPIYWIWVYKPDKEKRRCNKESNAQLGYVHSALMRNGLKPKSNLHFSYTIYS